MPVEKKRNPWRGWLLKLLITLALFIVMVGALTLNLLAPLSPHAEVEPRRIVIEQGLSARQIARQLAQEGIIKNAAAFHLLNRLTRKEGHMQAGVYDLAAHESPRQLLDRLYQGDTVNAAIAVTIPEGYTLKQIAQVLAGQGIVSEAEFMAEIAKAPPPYAFLEEMVAKLEPERRLEGYLFPDTYYFLPETPAQAVVKTMTNRFKEVMADLVPAEVLQGEKLQSGPLPLSLGELVILASIVEKEAMVAHERATIAGVFYNRLKINQRLGSCATVQYVLGVAKPILSNADMAIDSPYNTYRNDGLSIGPIASPGAASLQAVVEPEKTVYYYFVAKEDGSGEHVFNKTFAEHEQSIKLIRNK